MMSYSLQTLRRNTNPSLSLSHMIFVAYLVSNITIYIYFESFQSVALSFSKTNLLIWIFVQGVVFPGVPRSVESDVLFVRVCRHIELYHANQPRIDHQPWPHSLLQIFRKIYCNGELFCLYCNCLNNKPNISLKLFFSLLTILDYLSLLLKRCSSK